MGSRPEIENSWSNVSDIIIDINASDKLPIETDNAKCLIFMGHRLCVNLYFTMDVDPGYKYMETFNSPPKWLMIGSLEKIPSLSFKLKNEI